ncbi:MAG: type I DNA topoisomerase [Minisyncoccia bacterium]
MKLIVVESPKKAKTIKKFLGKEYYIIASYGHILDLPKEKFGVYLKDNKIEYEYKTTKRGWRFVKFLKKILDKIEEVILATDPDREGEFIAWSITRFLKDNRFYRIRFFEITKSAILKALKNKEGINQNLVYAQQSRRFLDRIIGYSLSPILWRKNIGKSAGRVQSAALRLIVEKEEEIRRFVPEVYFEMIADFGKFKAKLLTKKKVKKEELEDIKDKIKNEAFVLIKKEEKEKILKKPTPIDTALLQRISFLKYRFSSPFTMKIAQSLYEKGYITYHRTDSFNISKEFLNKVKDYLGDYFDYPKIKKSKFSQEAHEAIRPVNLEKINFKNEYEEKLYNLIFYYTLSACSKNALIKEKDYYFAPENFKDYIFFVKGEELIYDGYLKFFPFKASFKDLPEIEERLKPKKIEIIKKETKPPSRYSESTLIKKLKELGIGRPSTYAEIIKTLYKRDYAKKEKGYLIPTAIGENVVNFLKENFSDIIDFKFTASMEESLDKIALGSLNYEKFIVEFWKEFKNKL